MQLNSLEINCLKKKKEVMLMIDLAIVIITVVWF